MKEQSHNRPLSTTNQAIEFDVHYLSSLRLWPDPTDAPDVPPENRLRQYMNAPISIGPELREQIRTSVNCQRVIERLRLEDMSLKETSTVKEEMLDTLRSILPQSPASKQQPQKADSHVAPKRKTIPAFGQVWTTQSKVEVWNGKALAHQWTFTPCTVVIVSPPKTMPWKDSFVRVVPITPTELWPESMLGHDEIKLQLPDGNTHVAHLWLNYPVSLSQLSSCIGILTDDQNENLELGIQAVAEGLPVTIEFNGGLPLDSKLDKHVFLERERLQEKASWLSATADARREKATLKCSQGDADRSRPRIPLRLLSLAAMVAILLTAAGLFVPQSGKIGCGAKMGKFGDSETNYLATRAARSGRTLKEWQDSSVYRGAYGVAPRMVILSPVGKTYSTQPMIITGGKEDKIYQVTITNLDDNQEKYKTTMTGYQLDWADTCFPPLMRGEVYSIHFYHNGNELTDQNNKFFIMNEGDAARLDSVLAPERKNDDANSNTNVVIGEVELLMQAECFSEARNILAQLIKSTPYNSEYLKMLRDCYAGLGMDSAAKAIEKRMAEARGKP